MSQGEGRVEITGLYELRHFFAVANDEMRAEAKVIVHDVTERAVDEMRATYPVGPTGNLRGRVRALYPQTGELVGVAIAQAPHAHLWEFGTKKRQTKAGANRGRMWGKTPKPAQVAVPIATRLRTEMFHRLVDVIRKFGFEVGD